MQIKVHFWSYYRDLSGTVDCSIEVPEGASVETAMTEIFRLHPKLAPLRKSTLVALGVDYAAPESRLREGDQLSFFPPVQGG